MIEKLNLKDKSRLLISRLTLIGREKRDMPREMWVQ